MSGRRKKRQRRREAPAGDPRPDAADRGRRRRWLRLGAVCLLLAVLLAGGVSLLTQPSPPTPPPESLGGLPPAVRDVIRRAQQSVLRDPSSADAWGNLGRVLSAHELEVASRRCFEQAARLDPNDFRWPYLHGISLSVEDPRAAANYYRRALELRPDSAALHCRLAEFEMGRRSWDEAERHLKEATRLKPDYARAWLDRATIAFQQGQLRESRQYAERAGKLAPDQRAPHAMLARVLAADGQQERAVEHQEIAQSLADRPLLWDDPIAASIPGLARDPDAVLRQAEQLVEQNNARQAAKLLDQLVNSAPPDPRPHLLLAKILREGGQLQQAEAILRVADDRFPGSVSVCFQLGVVRFFQGRYRSAADQFRRAARYKPDHALAHYNLGHCLLKLDERDAAREAFENAVRFQPGHADARINLGRLLWETGDARAARAQMMTAARLKPEDPEPRRLLQEWSAGS